MRTKTKIAVLATLAAICSAALQSCMSDDTTDNSKNYANAIVTIKPNADNSQMYLQVDGSTLALPTNRKASPYGTKEVRALANISDVDGEAKAPANKLVFVNWIDSILTKSTAPNLFAAKNDSAYGTDPVEIVKSFESVAEDGYLTLRFRTYWEGKRQHSINLVHRTDANTPYLFTLYHNAYGERSGAVNDGIVAFRLPDELNAGSDTITLTLQWKSYTKNAQGDSLKTTTFKYVPRK